MDEAERCSRIGLMYNGRLIEQGTPKQIKALIPGELIEFRPESDKLHGVGLLRQANQILSRQAGVLEVQSYGDLIHVFVDNINQRRPELEQALAAGQIRMANFRPTMPRMEEAFISLIGKITDYDNYTKN
jgi:ABC-2 type transport system ATP-binding protein